MHLYELSEELREIMAEQEENPDNELLRSELSKIIGEFNEKIESIGQIIQELEYDTDTITLELQRLTVRKKVINNRIEWLKTYALDEMVSTKHDKVPGKLLTISVAKSPKSVVVLNKDEVEKQFRRIIPETFEVDKPAVLSHFESTGEIPKGLDIKTDGKYLRIK